MAVVSVVVEIVRSLLLLEKNFLKILPCRAVKCYKIVSFKKIQIKNYGENFAIKITSKYFAKGRL